MLHAKCKTRIAQVAFGTFLLASSVLLTSCSSKLVTTGFSGIRANLASASGAVGGFIGGVFHLNNDASQAYPNRKYPVWFGTNRKPNATGNGFTDEPNRTNTYGRIVVHVPSSHRRGEVGNPAWKRILRGYIADDNLKVDELHALPQDEFYREIKLCLNRYQAELGISVDQSTALVFIHGYNVGFESAAVRAAQLGWDLGLPGPTAFYSWPSKDTLLDYPADSATIADSEELMTEFLVDFAKNCGTKNVNIIAHSMGNRGLLRCLQRIESQDPGLAVRFNQIILAAPDVTQNLFTDLGRSFGRRATRTTLYASNRDRAIKASTEFWKRNVAGYFKPFTVVEGIDTVAVHNYDADFIGHSYYGDAPAVLDDIKMLILFGSPPSKRPGISRIVEEDNLVWRFDASSN